MFQNVNTKNVELSELFQNENNAKKSKEKDPDSLKIKDP